MIELAWFAAGAVLSVLATRTWVVAHRRTSPPAPPRPRPAPPVCTVDAGQLAQSIAEEIANLSSGVEVGAHRLVEAVADRASVPNAAAAMLGAVGRLRTLHRKLVAVSTAGDITSGSSETTAVGSLLAGLERELEPLQLGLEVCHEPSVHLPRIAVPPAIAHDALLFLCTALLRTERGATHLAMVSELGFAGRDARVQLEFAVEWIADAPAAAGTPCSDTTVALDLEAARRLVTASGGELVVTHVPRRFVRAVVHWPVEAEASPAPRAAAVPRSTAGHRYGGALVLESDPSVRAMLASELKATGRAVFACADGASARTFLEATPDRFELLIVDDSRRLDGADALGTTIRTVTPDLKIFVLAAARGDDDARWPHLHRIQKPFDALELRTALATILAAG